MKKFRLLPLLILGILCMSPTAIFASEKNTVYSQNFDNVSSFADLPEFKYRAVKNEEPTVCDTEDGGRALRIKFYGNNVFNTPELDVGVYSLSFRVKADDDPSAVTGGMFEMFYNPDDLSMNNSGYYLKSKTLTLLTDDVFRQFFPQKLGTKNRVPYMLKSHPSDWVNVSVKFVVREKGVQQFWFGAEKYYCLIDDLTIENLTSEPSSDSELSVNVALPDGVVGVNDMAGKINDIKIVVTNSGKDTDCTVWVITAIYADENEFFGVYLNQIPVEAGGSAEITQTLDFTSVDNSENYNVYTYIWNGLDENIPYCDEFKLFE